MTAHPEGPFCWAYAWPQSARPGAEVAVYVSSSAPRVSVEVARLGAARETVWRAADVAVGAHELGTTSAAEGCDWPEALRVPVGADWRSGYYEILVRAEQAGQVLTWPAFTVIRAPASRRRRMLLPLSTNTWQAYNDFADGQSLYTGGVTVSFRRPLAPGFLQKPPGLGRRVAAVHTPDPLRAAHKGYKVAHGLSDWCGSAGWPNWEEGFVAWAERSGYEIDFAVNSDLEFEPGLLDGYRLMLSVGHDEYWSMAMRDAVERFVGQGGNVAFLSGNTSSWQVRFEPDSSRMVCYKYRFQEDPCLGTDREREVTTIWSDRILGRPENELTGVSFTRGGYARIGTCVPRGSGGYTVHRPDHWLFDGTGLSYGDLLGAGATVVGYECDGCDFTYVDGLPYPTSTDGTPPNFQILATSSAMPFDRARGVRPIPDDQPSELENAAWRVLGTMDEATCARLEHGHCVLGTFERNGSVVTTGCTDWVLGLGADADVDRVTRNILDRLGPDS